jgi:hypothetical protein
MSASSDRRARDRERSVSAIWQEPAGNSNMAKAAHQLRIERNDRYGAQFGAFAMAAQTSPMPTMITDSMAPGYPILFANEAFLAMPCWQARSRHCLVLQSMLNPLCCLKWLRPAEKPGCGK